MSILRHYSQCELPPNRRISLALDRSVEKGHQHEQPPSNERHSMKDIPMLGDEKHQVRIKRYVSNGVSYIPSFIEGRIITEPLVTVGITILMEDKNGDILQLGLYNMLSDGVVG